MNIILLKKINKLGSKNDIVNVKNGYANNYLIPNKYAIIANKENIKKLNEKLKNYQFKHDKLLKQSLKIKHTLENNVINIKTKSSNNSKIFGSITSIQISESIKNNYNFNISRKNINIIDKNIKSLGVYNALISLYKDIKFEIKFEVTKE